MKILFDFDFKKGVSKEDVTEGTPGRAVLNRMTEFVESRLRVLKDEIDAEKDDRIFISLSPSRIYMNMRPELANKIMQSMTEDDYNHLMNFYISKMI